MRSIKPILALAVLSSFFLVSCDKNKTFDKVDEKLYEFCLDSVGYTSFYLQDTLLPISAGSAHGQPFLKTRYNTIAASKLDGSGRIQEGISFPEGSVIVKELINSNEQIERYAVLWKNSTNQFADDKGWVWGYINGDGSVAISAAQKGNSCISCHSQAGNIDYSLMNLFFP